MKTLNMFYFVIYWTQKVHNDFIFLCGIVLPPVGHSSDHIIVETYRHSSCGSNFYRTYKVSIWLSSVLTKANEFSYNAKFVTVHRCSSAEAGLSGNAAVTLRITSSLLTACFGRKGQRRKTGQKEVKIRRLIQQMRLPHWISNGHYTGIRCIHRARGRSRKAGV